MGKDNYDDMTDRPSRRSDRDTYQQRPSRGLIWTIALGIAICVVVIVVWYQFFPNEKESSAVGSPVVITEKPKQVDVINDAPKVEVPTPLNEPVKKAVDLSSADAPVIDNQARSLSDVPTTSSSNSSKKV